MSRMTFVHDDGGRKAAGYTGSAGDCVTRAVTIVTGLPYQQVYDALAEGTGTQRASSRTKTKGRTARAGINVTRQWFKTYMAGLGFVWVPTMGIGTGCRVHLAAGELPAGRLVVAVSKHYTAVLDGVIHDTHDPQRDGDTIYSGTPVLDTDGQRRNPILRTTGGRCVYGYWRLDV